MQLPARRLLPFGGSSSLPQWVEVRHGLRRQEEVPHRSGPMPSRIPREREVPCGQSQLRGTDHFLSLLHRLANNGVTEPESVSPILNTRVTGKGVDLPVQ